VFHDQLEVAQDDKDLLGDFQAMGFDDPRFVLGFEFFPVHWVFSFSG
jgi:hypothetical protein